MVEGVSYRAWATIIILVAMIILGSIWFLQTSGSPRPSTYEEIGTELGSGRIDLAEHGFAVTTPEGWTAWEPSTDFQDWWGANVWVRLWMEPTPEPGTEEWWMGTCGIGEECTLERMVEVGGEAFCWVVDDSELAAEADWDGPATPAELTATSAEEQGWTEVSTAVEALPSGEAAMMRATDPNGWPQEIWHLSDGERWHRVFCSVLDSDVEPIQVAQTFEYLPPPAGD